MDEEVKSRIIKYDNTFNKTSLSLLTKVQTDVLLSVLSRMGECVNEDDCYVAIFTFREIREMTGSKNFHASRIKKVFDTLLDTKVEFYSNDTYEKGNLFSHYSINNNSEAQIVLTKHMTNKLIPNASEYTILKLDEYVELPSPYSKEVYRLLRQFRHSGVRLITKEDLIKMLQPPKSYNEYDFVRKVLIPAVEENKVHFENLTVNIGDKNKLPNVVKFMFKPHKKIKGKNYDNSNSKSKDNSLLEYVKANTQIGD